MNAINLWRQNLESLKKRLDFNCEGPASPEPSKASEGRNTRNDSFDDEASDDFFYACKRYAVNFPGSDVDGSDVEREIETASPKMTKKEFVSAVNPQRTRSSKKLFDKNISQPLEEQNVFPPRSKPIFDKLKILGEKSFECKFDLPKAILKLLALQEAKMKESSEVYQALEKIRGSLLKKIESFHYAETLIVSLFTNSIKGAFSSAMDVKSVQNLAQSVSAKVATRKEIPTSKGNSDSKVTKGKIDRLAEKQSGISRLAKQNAEGTSMKLRSMTNAGKKTEAPQKPVATTAKPKTSVPKPAPAKPKAAPASKIPSRSAPSTRKGKENVGKQLGLPVAQSKKNEKPLGENQEREKVAEETKGEVKEEGETADASCVSFQDLPTTPVTTRPVQRKSISDTRIGKVGFSVDSLSLVDWIFPVIIKCQFSAGISLT